MENKIREQPHDVSSCVAGFLLLLGVVLLAANFVAICVEAYGHCRRANVVTLNVTDTVTIVGRDITITIRE